MKQMDRCLVSRRVCPCSWTSKPQLAQTGCLATTLGLTCCIVWAAGVASPAAGAAAVRGTSASAANGEVASGPTGSDTPALSGSGAAGCGLLNCPGSAGWPAAAPVACAASAPSGRGAGGKHTNSNSKEGAIISTAPVLPESR